MKYPHFISQNKIGLYLTVFAFITAIVMKPALWLSDPSFPLVPVLESFPIPSLWVSKFILGFFLLGLLLFTISQNKIVSFVVLSLVTFLFLTDINRLQPSFYIMALLLFCYAFQEKTKSSMQLVVLLFAAVYFWSGIHKLNPHFLEVWLNGLNKRIPFVPYFLRVGFTYAIPFLEAGFGLALLFKSTRKIGCLLLVLMHLIILTAFVLMKTGSNVVPINVLMIGVLLTTIYPEKSTFKAIIGFSIQKSFLIALIWLLPISNFFGYWDHFVSFSIFSGKPKYAYLVINDAHLEQELPKEIRPYIMEYNNQKIISISGLAFDTKAIMIYPETRVYEKIKDYFDSFSSTKDKKATTLVEF